MTNDAPTDDGSQIEQLLQTHPLTLSLRTIPQLIESRLYDQIPESMRSNMFTCGNLLKPGRIVVPPIVFTNEKCKSATFIFYLGAALSGYEGIIHGGLLATVLDEAFATCASVGMLGKAVLTMNLNIDYQNPALTEEMYILKTNVVRVEGNIGWIRGQIQALRDDGNCDEVVAEGKGKYMYVDTRRK